MSPNSAESAGMSPTERSAAISLALIYAIRMLGLFMLLPVMALYAEEMVGVTPVLIGLAIGIYGLTQAILQIPMGVLSDRLGRKWVITFGLIVFAIGSVIAGMADSIWQVILGRALQGAGAISAVVMALAADLTRETQRSKVMAVIGVSIGAAFIMAMVVGPIVYELLGGPGLFYLIGLLALLGITILWTSVPSVSIRRLKATVSIKALFLDSQLQRLNISILFLHMILTALFLVVPYILRDYLGVEGADHWWVYSVVMLGAVFLMGPTLVLAERHHKVYLVFLLSIAALGLSLLGLSVVDKGIYLFCVCLIIFFAAFNLLEALLPSWVSKLAPLNSRGAALGLYSSAQFLGAFLGGLLGGLVLQWYGLQGVFWAGSLIALIWLMIAIGLRSPRNFNHYTIKLVDSCYLPPHQLIDELTHIRGVEEAYITEDERVVCLKVDKVILDKAALSAYAV